MTIREKGKKSKRIIVLGGSGVTGSLIARDLLRHLPASEVHTGSRKDPPGLQGDSASRMQHVRIDLDNEQEALAVLSGYDLAVIAVGPFNRFKGKPHRLCIKAGIDCLDVNDELEASVDIIDCQKEAARKGVRVLTGMGLNPGLMTLLLTDVLQRSAGSKGKKRLSLRLSIGARQDAGYASVHVMLQGFMPDVAVLKHGIMQHVTACDQRSDALYYYPVLRKKIASMHCSTPQVYTLPRFRHLDVSSIEHLDFRIHFQGLPSSAVKLLRRWSWLKRDSIRNLLAGVIYSIQKKSKNKRGNREESIAVAQCDTNGKTYRTYAHGKTSYQMTALFASAMTELFLDNHATIKPGVYTLEDGCIIESRLYEALNKRDITIIKE
jgi:saccharopine dehydrogenase-like NADP-dependent oxidoreductase